MPFTPGELVSKL